MQTQPKNIEIRTVVSDSFFEGRILILVPHMDDAVLGCGGLLASITDKSRVRLVYCTDGRGSMSREERANVLNTDQDIGLIRKKETYAALSVLGYSEDQITFLPFQEWHLAKQKDKLGDKIIGFIKKFDPDRIFIPSRYDKHVDHLLLNSESINAVVKSCKQIPLFEYFVYYEWKFLPSGDIRDYIKPARLLQTDIGYVSDEKRRALDCFVSQTTRYYEWQHKPVLSNELLSRFAAGPELFMQVDPGLRESDFLTVSPLLIHMLNRLEPFLKNIKEKLLSIKHCKLRRKNVD